jgi:hypothetical protein
MIIARFDFHQPSLKIDFQPMRTEQPCSNERHWLVGCRGAFSFRGAHQHVDAMPLPEPHDLAVRDCEAPLAMSLRGNPKLAPSADSIISHPLNPVSTTARKLWPSPGNPAPNQGAFTFVHVTDQLRQCRLR